MKVAIRTDSSLSIGTGHVVRCLTLADELKKQGADVFFICRSLPGNIISVISDKGYPVITLAAPDVTESINLDRKAVGKLAVPVNQDAQETHDEIVEHGDIDWLIVDHYAIEKTWQTKLRCVVKKILVIDDLADRLHDCDVLLDQNYYDNKDERYKKLVPKSCQQVLGPEFALLRSEFYEIRQKLLVRDHTLQNIFVFFGGVDFTNMTSRVLEAFTKIKIDARLIINVVIGKTNPHREEVELLCKKNKQIKLHVQVKDMAKMIADADLAIGSGGTITWERFCLGLPSIAWPVAENQEKILSDCANAGLIYSPDSNAPTVKEIAMHINAVMQNSALRNSMSCAGKTLVDGKGTQRLVSLMLKPEIELRAASSADMQKIYQWRNDSRTREYSRNTDELDFEQHSKWFNDMLLNDNQLVFIGSINSDEIGVLRFDINEHQAELSIYLVPGEYGKGYGSALIAAAECWLLKHRTKICEVIAEVLPENTASNKLFEKSGYKLNKVQYIKRII